MNCPHCDTALTSGDLLNGDICHYCSENLKMSASPDSDDILNNAGSTISNNCPICCCEFVTGEDTVICPDCQTTYHKECWEENKGCAIYGCKSVQSIGAPDNVFSDAKFSKSLSACLWCHALLSEPHDLCPMCCKPTNTAPPTLNNKLAVIWEKIAKNLLATKGDLQLAWKKAQPSILYIFSCYKNGLAPNAIFLGTTSRREFTGFALITSIIIFLLSRFGNSTIIIMYVIGTLLPTLAIMVRRLRDIGLTPHYLLAGPLLSIILFFPSIHKEETEGSHTT